MLWGLNFKKKFIIRWIVLWGWGFINICYKMDCVMGMGFYKIFVIRCMSYIIVGDVRTDSYYNFFRFEFRDSLRCRYISIG